MPQPNPSLAQLEDLFETAQGRAQQWFATHTRIITVISAVVAAFVLQLDAFELVQRISSDADVRSKLIAQAENLQKDADKVLQDSDIGDVALHKKILQALRAKHPDLPASLDQRPQLSTMTDLERWLRDNLKGRADVETVVTEYKQSLYREKLDPLSNSFSRIYNAFDETGLPLLRQPYPRVLAKQWRLSHPWPIFSGEWSWPRRRLFGIAISAMLLSLGAPFWFNTLKSLASLKPKVAEQIDRRASRGDQD